MALEPDGGGGAKKRRVYEKGAQRQEAAEGPEAAPVDHISGLPDDVRRRILTRLPLKDAIRTAALAKGWRDFWKSRWAEPTSCSDIHLVPGDNPRKALASLESDPPRRLDRFSFVSDTEKLRQPHLKRFLAYAADCRVEDLHVEVRRCNIGKGRLIFHLPLSSPLLVHLSLRNVDMCHMYYKGVQPFYGLESIHLHSVNIGVKFSKVMALCPRLHTLDLRRCSFGDILYDGKACTPLNLRRFTVAECNCSNRQMRLGFMPAPSLCSFRYRGNFLGSLFFLPKDVVLADLYICFSDREPFPPCYSIKLEEALPDDLSGLNVLTISSNVLEVAGTMFMYRSIAQRRQWAKMNHSHSFRELELLMIGMEMGDLANIYWFFSFCHCSNLERLFVQLPATSDVPLEDSSVEEVRVKMPEDVLVNLRMVKVMNFNWRRFEVQLVSFLLRKATSLHKMLLVSPNVDPLHVPGVQEADLSLIKEALARGRIIVTESDDRATQPFHSEIFLKV